MTRNYWKKICAIPAYMFLLSPSGNRVQKMEGGNWIDQHEAQKVVDAAEDELSGLRAENEALRKGWYLNECGDNRFWPEEMEELKAENESLRKDAERLKKATEFVQRLCDSAGTQPSVATGYLHDILSELTEEPSNGR